MGCVCALMPYCIESDPKWLWHNSAPEKDVIKSVTHATGGLVEIVTEYFHYGIEPVTFWLLVGMPSLSHHWA